MRRAGLPGFPATNLKKQARNCTGNNGITWSLKDALNHEKGASFFCLKITLWIIV
jgi:hypothetical protein